ncbi:MAG: CHAD domain-containing protein [Acidobacteria bacterium]|nr:CHAD domain-containing protein [Acidobacteriota bacterium]
MRLYPNKSARENAARMLPRLAQELLDAGDRAIARGYAAKRLHPLRILSKRFRYSLEFFRPCFGPAMDSYLTQVKDLQQSLGELNDCYSSTAFYQRLSLNQDKSLPAVLQHREEQLLEKFRAQWRQGFQHDPWRQRLLRYLAHPLRRRKGEAHGKSSMSR